LGTKICAKCGEEKELNTNNFIWKETYWLNKCRSCDNEERREKRAQRKGLDYHLPKHDHKEDYMAKLSDAEIENLKILSNKKDEIVKLLDQKIKIDESSIGEAGREKISITIDRDILNKIQHYRKKYKKNQSEIINIMLKKALEFMD
jgi:uncharacterized protein (DUF4415 family)